MEEIKIHKFQAETIQNALRLVSNTLHCNTKETCLDREVCQAMAYIQNALSGEINKRVSRF